MKPTSHSESTRSRINGCLNCQSKAYRTISNLPPLRAASALGNSQIAQCNECGFIYSYNYPTDTDTLRQLNEDLAVSFEVPQQRSATKVSRLVELSKSAGLRLDQLSILDFGSGNSSFAQEMKEYCVEARAYEPFAPVTSGQRTETVTDLRELSWGSRPVMVTGFHVLEHLTDPRNFLRTLHTETSISAEYLAIEVPILDLEIYLSLDPTPFWAPFHVSHFTRFSLLAMLESEGWAPLLSYAFPDYNGYLVLARRTHVSHTYTSSLRLEEQKALVDSYQRMREVSLRGLSESLTGFIAGLESCLLWGAGVGLDYFMQILPRDLSREMQICDSDTRRQGMSQYGYVQSPSAVLQEGSINGMGVIPTSYAKSDEIASQVTTKFPGTPVFRYECVRAY